MQFTEGCAAADHPLQRSNDNSLAETDISIHRSRQHAVRKPRLAGAVALAPSLASASARRRLSREGDHHRGARPRPGGANDAMARVIGQAMSAILKQPVIVDNKAGANGAIASEFVDARRARRLHADARLHRHARDEPGAAKAALRPGEGLRAGRHGRLVGHADGRQPDGQGRQREGDGGAAQGRARQDQLRIGRQRHRARTSRPRCSSWRPAPACCTCRTRARRRP